jgi:hypothetical protein
MKKTIAIIMVTLVVLIPLACIGLYIGLYNYFAWQRDAPTTLSYHITRGPCLQEICPGFDSIEKTYPLLGLPPNYSGIKSDGSYAQPIDNNPDKSFGLVVTFDQQSGTIKNMLVRADEQTIAAIVERFGYPEEYYAKFGVGEVKSCDILLHYTYQSIWIYLRSNSDMYFSDGYPTKRMLTEILYSPEPPDDDYMFKFGMDPVSRILMLPVIPEQLDRLNDVNDCFGQAK